jgi:dipeptidase
MRWYSSEEGHNFWKEFYREERNWTDYAAERIRFYLNLISPPPEEDIWL